MDYPLDWRLSTKGALIMKLIFFQLAAAYLLLFILRWLLSLTYLKKGKSSSSDFQEELYTVVQPILSGDPRLENDLLANLQQTEAVEFYWLIDQSDPEAQRVADKICQNLVNYIYANGKNNQQSCDFGGFGRYRSSAG